jgi:hypothetical protein
MSSSIAQRRQFLIICTANAPATETESEFRKLGHDIRFRFHNMPPFMGYPPIHDILQPRLDEFGIFADITLAQRDANVLAAEMYL